MDTKADKICSITSAQEWRRPQPNHKPRLYQVAKLENYGNSPG